MFGFGGGKPRFCLKVGSRGLVWGEHVRTWRGRHCYRCQSLPLPADSIKLSPIEPNVINHVAVEERLRSLAGFPGRVRWVKHIGIRELPRPITLLLSDLAVRTIILSLDHVPSQNEELEALIRWRLGQEQRLPLSGTKLIWQVFPASETGDDSHLVLVVVIQDGILHQYETVCEAVGFVPQEVGVTSFSSFNLWLRAAGGFRRLDHDLAWVTVMDGALTCFILHQKRPVFVRTKLLPEEQVHSAQEAGDIEERVLREISASFVACQEQYPHVQAKEIILMTADSSRHWESTLSRELGVSVECLTWNHIDVLGWKACGGGTSLAALPAVAGMI
ncbi:MAG: conserved protein of unknown function [Nitrospira sp.]